MNVQDDPIKFAGDGLSATIIASSIAGWLPSIAAALSIIWFALRIYETCTVQRWLHGSSCKPEGEK